VLIAEDEDAVRGLVARALEDDGHIITTAADGAEALDALADDVGGYDLLLTDIKMPVLDGLSLAMAAACERPDMVIMLMTGYAEQRERAHNIDALVHDVVPKPFSVEQIRLAVREALAPRH